MSVRENVPKGTKVFKLEATDLDAGINGSVSYRLIDQVPMSSDEAVFKLDGKTGELFTEGPIDREVVGEYEVSVEAVDGGGLVASKTLTVAVEDANDHAPSLESLRTVVVKFPARSGH